MKVRCLGCLTVLNFIILCSVVAVRIGAPIPAKAQTLSDENLKNLDDFFNDHDRFSSSGCDQATWNLIHQTARLVSSTKLPPSSVDEDIARAEQIDVCAQKANEARRSLVQVLVKINNDSMKGIASLGPDRYSNPDTHAFIHVLANLESDVSKNAQFLDWMMTQQILYGYASQASQMYVEHADRTQYTNLVNRYNALANSLANVRLAQGSSFPIQPRPLHCEAKTNSVTGITQMDCE